MRRSNIKITILSIIVLVLAGLCIYILFYYKNDEITYHTENTITFAECLEGDDNFCKTFNMANEIYFTYPVIDGNSNVIVSLNKGIKEEINGYVSTLENTASDKTELANTPCGKIKILKNNFIYNESHFYYYRYKVIDSNNFISIILYEEVLSSCASSWTDIAKVYIYDKINDKMISQESLKLPNRDGLIKIASQSRLNDLVEDETYTEELKALLDDKQYYLYYLEDGNLVITFSEPETNGILINYIYKEGTWHWKEN